MSLTPCSVRVVVCGGGVRPHQWRAGRVRAHVRRAGALPCATSRHHSASRPPPPAAHLGVSQVGAHALALPHDVPNLDHAVQPRAQQQVPGAREEAAGGQEVEGVRGSGHTSRLGSAACRRRLRAPSSQPPSTAVVRAAHRIALTPLECPAQVWMWRLGRKHCSPSTRLASLGGSSQERPGVGAWVGWGEWGCGGGGGVRSGARQRLLAGCAKHITLHRPHHRPRPLCACAAGAWQPAPTLVVDQGLDAMPLRVLALALRPLARRGARLLRLLRIVLWWVERAGCRVGLRSGRFGVLPASRPWLSGRPPTQPHPPTLH